MTPQSHPKSRPKTSQERQKAARGCPKGSKGRLGAAKGRKRSNDGPPAAHQEHAKSSPVIGVLTSWLLDVAYARVFRKIKQTTRNDVEDLARPDTLAWQIPFIL